MRLRGIRTKRESGPGFYRGIAARNGQDWRSAAALAVGEKRDPIISSLAISLAVIYSEQASGITVWAVAHGSRLPEYWKDRLP
jgi:hypothetical protein